MIGTKIEWATDTVNFWWGCSKVSPACDHCYAEAMDLRFHGPRMLQLGGGSEEEVPGQGRHWGSGELVPRLLKVGSAIREIDKIRRRASKGRWKCLECSADLGAMQAVPVSKLVCSCGGAVIEFHERPRVFINSMSDFGELREELTHARLVALVEMRLSPEVDFLILSKRNHIHWLQEALQAAESTGLLALEGWLKTWVAGKPPKNIWLGATVESQPYMDLRERWLLNTPAAVRFLSVEPMLGPIAIPQWINLPTEVRGDFPFSSHIFAEAGIHRVTLNPYGARSVETRAGRQLGIKPGECEDLGFGVDWIICGGESGTKGRPMHPDWVRSLRDQCIDNWVPFFFKQWGEWAPIDQPWAQQSPLKLGRREQWLNRAGGMGFHGEDVWRMRAVGKKAAGRMVEGREWNQVPEVKA